MGTLETDPRDEAGVARIVEASGGARRDRTADLLHAMQALSQLSYGPTAGKTTSLAGGFRKRQASMSTRFMPDVWVAVGVSMMAAPTASASTRGHSVHARAGLVHGDDLDPGLVSASAVVRFGGAPSRRSPPPQFHFVTEQQAGQAFAGDAGHPRTRGGGPSRHPCQSPSKSKSILDMPVSRCEVGKPAFLFT